MLYYLQMIQVGYCEVVMAKKERLVFWSGEVDAENFKVVTEEILKLWKKNRQPIRLIITSPGGSMRAALGFYDFIKDVCRIPLRTTIVGHADSSALILFVAGSQRQISANSTMVFHPMGLSDEGEELVEERIREKEKKVIRTRYGSLIAENSSGKLTLKQVLQMVDEGAFLEAQEVVEKGIAHEIVGQEE